MFFWRNSNYLTEQPQFTLGLDPGYANTGFGLLNRDRRIVTSGTFTTAPKDGDFWLRLAMMCEQVKLLTEPYLPLAVVIESYQYYANKTEQSGSHQARHNAVLGGFFNTFVALGCEVAMYEPTEAKALGAGYDYANKAAIKAAVKMRLGKVCNTDHEADALMLADMHTSCRATAVASLGAARFGKVTLIRRRGGRSYGRK